MFYVKASQPSGKMVKTDISDENVFTRCPECGKELPVDLAELFSDGEGDMQSTSVLCSACVSKRTVKRSLTDGMQITTDGLALLSNTLCKVGYGEQVYDLFDQFGIDEVQKLKPGQYRPFAEALSGLVIEEDAL